MAEQARRRLLPLNNSCLPDKEFREEPRLPETAKAEMLAVLDFMERYGLRGIVYGGYIRDRIMSLPPVDMDVLVTDAQVEQVLSLPGWTLVPTPPGKPEDQPFAPLGEYGESLSPRFQVGYFQTPHCAVPVNVVRTEFPVLNLSTYLCELDFGLCQAAFTLQEGTRVSDAFNTDLRLRQLTLRRHNTSARGDQRSRERAQRLCKRLGVVLESGTAHRLQLLELRGDTQI